VPPVGRSGPFYVSDNFNRQYLEEEFEDTKGVIRIRISKKNRQHNGQKKKYKRTNNDLQAALKFAILYIVIYKV
jgi:hypothetical protein